MNAIRTLGIRNYLKYIFFAVLNLPRIIRYGNLVPLDQVMGRHSKHFRFHGFPVSFDCARCDDMVHDGTFSFGAVRELYIRDCYFRHLPKSLVAKMETAVDLGANRGCMSSALAGICKKVVSIEADEMFAELLRENVAANARGKNCEVLIGFVGSGGASATGYSGVTIDMSEIVSKFDNGRIDFVIMDIEGSEFALFENPTWLKAVNHISIEIHRNFGDPSLIGKTLEAFDFEVIYANEDLEILDGSKNADFIYGIYRHSREVNSGN